MRHGTAGRRSRNRGSGGGNNNRRGGGGGGGGGHSRTQVFDSNGPDVRIRGTAFQIQEKYVALAKDAAASGDRILAESYLQHAEHYQRIINSFQPVPQAQPQYDAGRFDADELDEEVFNAKRSQEKAEDQSSDNDLSLPASILGQNAQNRSERARESATAESGEYADA